MVRFKGSFRKWNGKVEHVDTTVTRGVRSAEALADLRQFA